ncbi:hypothetical protein GIS00_12175 [Nakamurella sp. YIM 132087]|uniref:Uncharacterized protein n=1 Tax=Nakamurella alba TaxID=2665158 RepID=A0A7K1FKM4_9ACTN|nr:hypothetical protein [Nakamurella alba]MTD14697.1 hypothetical protein [Nakamurella alba]
MTIPRNPRIVGRVVAHRNDADLYRQHQAQELLGTAGFEHDQDGSWHPVDVSSRALNMPTLDPKMF